MDDFTAPRVSPVTADAAAERVTAFLRTVYGWMFVGLGVTAAVAYTVAGSPAITWMLFPRVSPMPDWCIAGKRRATEVPRGGRG